MKNIYVIRLTKSVKIEVAPHFGSRETSQLYVVASSFNNASEAALRKYPGIEIRGIDLLNYLSVPIVIGE